MGVRVSDHRPGLLRFPAEEEKDLRCHGTVRLLWNFLFGVMDWSKVLRIRTVLRIRRLRLQEVHIEGLLCKKEA